jgi:hypothetical protein
MIVIVFRNSSEDTKTKTAVYTMCTKNFNKTFKIEEI